MPAVPMVFRFSWRRSPVLINWISALNSDTVSWFELWNSSIVIAQHVRIASLWRVVAEFDINLEVHVLVGWDPVSTKWSLDTSTTVDKLTWAVDFGRGTWLELGNGKIEALESLRSTNGEDKIFSFNGLRVHDLLSISKESLVADLSPVSIFAEFFAVSLLGDINTNLRHVNSWGNVLVVYSIWSECIWSILDSQSSGCGE
jgi:hypothetical protein